MIVFGIILICAGAASYIYGDRLNNSFEMQLKSLFGNGTTNPGSIFITIGVVVAIIGLILAIIGIAKKFQHKSISNERTCPHCGKQIVANASFCAQCGNKIG